jgi:hypothetical protein
MTPNRFLLACTLACTTLLAHAQFESIPLGKSIPDCKAGGSAAGNCIAAIEKKALQQSAGMVSRKAGQLQFNFKPEALTLSNNDADNKDYINYTYFGYDATLQQHIVYVGFYEGDQYLAIHGTTGQQSKMRGYPAISPDKKHFATMSVDMIAGFNPNEVEIWQVNGGEIKKLASIKGEKWGPDGIRWVKPDRLEVKKVCNSPDPERQELILKCGTAFIAPGKAGWALLP